MTTESNEKDQTTCSVTCTDHWDYFEEPCEGCPLTSPGVHTTEETE